MKTVDITIPYAEGSRFLRNKVVTLILPREHPISKGTDIDHTFRIVLCDDTFSEGSPPKILKDEDLTSYYYGIRYIRECMLRDVIKAEWKTCYGPSNYLEFAADPAFQKFLGNGLDSYVKVINLLKAEHSLKDLVKNYGKEQKRRKFRG